VLSCLDFILCILILQNSCPGTASTWTGQILNNLTEATLQTNLIKNKIVYYQNSSLTNIYNQLDFLAKSTTRVIYKIALIEQEILDFCTANKLLSKHRRAKKTYLRLGGLLLQQEAEQIQEEKGLVAEGNSNIYSSRGYTEGAELYIQHCKNCSKTGYNIQTCQIVWEISEDRDSE
jgi:hypothetical protein